MTLFDFLKLAAACWYVSYIVTNKPGLFGIFERLREFKGGRWHGRKTAPEYVVTLSANTSYETTELKGGERIHDGLLDCIICLAPYVALALLLIGANVVTDAFAVAGVALMLHSYSGWRINI